MSTLSTLATFDDIRRCIQVLTDGTAEEEFLKVLRLQEKFRQECLATAHETQRIQKELDASLQNMADLETKLFHARRLLELESKARREAEHDRDQMERKILAVADLLENERNLKDETKDKLAFLNTLSRKRKSLNPHIEEKYGNDINSTGSFLSDLSITQSEEDFLDPSFSKTKTWQRHRPSIPKNNIPAVGGKRSRTSIGGNTITSPPASTSRRSGLRRSGLGVQHHTIDLPTGSDRICATTKVTIPQDGQGVIRAESTIESVPIQVDQQPIDCISAKTAPTPQRSPVKEPTAPPFTPVKMNIANIIGSPAVRPAMMRQHNFYTKTCVRSDICVHCQKKIRFGVVGIRCRNCPIRCHADCRPILTVSCVPQGGTPTLKGLALLSDYAPAVPPMIPPLIVYCVSEIENRGLNEVGIYRVSGSEREIKSLKERFLRGKGTPHLGNIDIHVLCGCVKEFLRTLREPLIPTGLWKDFCNAAQNPSQTDTEKDLYNAISLLPQPNRDTLAFLVLHFQRIAECEVVRMPLENLARVFGPTIIGNSSAEPDQHALLTEIHIQLSVMLSLLKIPTEYWTQFILVESDKENQTKPAPPVVARTPSKNKEFLYSLYATPLKSTVKKRKFYPTPPQSAKK